MSILQKVHGSFFNETWKMIQFMEEREVNFELAMSREFPLTLMQYHLAGI